VPRRTSKSLTTWKEKALAKAKAKQASRPVGGDNPVISIKGGVFTYNGAPMPETINVVVLDEIMENSVYREKFKENEFKSPMCYAFSEPMSIAEGELGVGMKPHPKSTEPQSVDCASCPKNQFGSDRDGGAGKDCGNRRRLMVMAADNLDDLDKAMIALIKVPPTGLKAWDAYCNWLYRIEEISPEYAITSLSLKKLRPTDQSAVPMYDFVGMLPDEICDQIDKIVERNREFLLQPFPEESGNVTKKTGARKKKPARRR